MLSATNPFPRGGFTTEESLATPVELFLDEIHKGRSFLFAKEMEDAGSHSWTGNSARLVDTIHA